MTDKKTSPGREMILCSCLVNLRVNNHTLASNLPRLMKWVTDNVAPGNFVQFLKNDGQVDGTGAGSTYAIFWQEQDLSKQKPVYFYPWKEKL